MNMTVDKFEVDLGFDIGDTEPRAVSQRVRMPGRCYHGLGRYAAIVEAIASHRPPLDKHYRHAKRGRGSRDRETARPGPDDADVRRYMLPHARIP